ncbi:polysaccharide pyruvyl transferase family protein [Stappia stellulata]|uniref:polysaccharide pyruvyl transferase family protein n=1 Tax=Stappia stellulata TaxID=71235 RepID=UPI001CD5605F|nr:polysaccharide pyruvyl transferase family protein [Stappia stellulata]MCA1243837.1 polysaccharide pyruvyl transferase family protein [Stappia stellulata]
MSDPDASSEMRKLTALHLASFVGNLGDNAMHDGEYRTRAADLPFCLDHRACEVRDFIHWHERSFDERFVADAARADVLVVGGFSVFQLWRDTTVSGTYLDVSAEFFANLPCPVLFHGLGCDATRGVNPLAVERTRAFLDVLLPREDCRFSLRNDGSVDLIRAHLGPRYADAMEIVPDGGLFGEPRSHVHAGLSADARFIAVNLAGDMPDKRYRSADGVDLTERFAREVADGLGALMAEDPTLQCVFVPHIYSDFEPISAVLDAFDDRLRRTRVLVAGLAQGEAGWSASFDLYRRASAAISMRYHASLGSIGFGTPVRGISTHHKVEGQFAAYGLAERCHPFLEHSDLRPLFAGLARDLADPEPVRRQFLEIRRSERARLSRYHGEVATWLMGQTGARA